MFTYCYQSDFQVFLDLTSPDGWENNEDFLKKIVQLSKKKHIGYASAGDQTIDGTADQSLQVNSQNLLGNIGMIIYDDLFADEAGVLIISNHRDHVKHFVELGFSTVFLKTDNAELDLDFATMPDEVWDYHDFYNFVDNPNIRMTYPAELIGFPNDFQLRTKLLKFPNKLSIPNTNKAADVVFTGRYFTSRDNRHYNHPLSRAIIGLKNNYLNQSKVAKDRLGKLIDFYLRSDSTVSHITFVPPRPNKRSRFIGVEEYTKTKVTLEPDLLYSKTDYPSPKGKGTFIDKYNYVAGKIGIKREISGHVLLIDDVYTSGATTAECAKILYENGADKVTVLPMAFTQHYNYEQPIMPVIFDADGNEYHIGFRKEDFGAYWFSRNDEGGFQDFKNFDLINEEYLEYHRAWSTKRVEEQEYHADKEIQAIIFDLDNTLLYTDHLEHYRDKKLAIEDKSLMKEEHIIIKPSLLSQLQQAGIKIGIVTRSPRKYAKSLLSAYNYPYDCLVASKDTLRTKPFPDPLIKCAIKLKVEPKFIVSIGDDATDLKAGNRAGMMSLHIDTVIGEHELQKILERNIELEI